MQDKARSITSFQFYSLLFASRTLIVLFINADFAGGKNFLDNVVSCLPALLLSFLLVIPTYLLFRSHPQTSVPALSVQLLGRFGKAVPLYYSLYYSFMDVFYLTMFLIFMGNALEPHVVQPVLCAVTIAAAAYASFLGLEAIARSAVFLLFIMLIGSAFVLIPLAVEYNPLHLRPLFADGPRQTLQGALMLFGCNTGLSTIAVLLPKVKGRRKRGFVWWNLLVYGFAALLIFIVVGACGDYLNEQLFPIYTASSLAGLGGFSERMDMLFVIAWMSGLFVQLAADLYIIRGCNGLVYKRGDSVSGMLLVCLLIVLVTQWVYNSLPAQSAVLNLWVILPLSLIGALGIPLLLLLVQKLRKGRLLHAQ